MSDAEIAMLQRLARRFHIPSVRLEFAKALALDGRLPAAEHELQVIRSSSDPARYRAIDRQWSAWLEAHGLERVPPATR